jgi:hypothetical protein
LSLLGGGGDGDVEAEGLELAEVGADLAVAAGLRVVPGGAEVGEPGFGVGEEVPDDDEDGAGDGALGPVAAEAPAKTAEPKNSAVADSCLPQYSPSLTDRPHPRPPRDVSARLHRGLARLSMHLRSAKASRASHGKVRVTSARYRQNGTKHVAELSGLESRAS